MEIAWWNSSSPARFLPPANYEITQERPVPSGSSPVLLFHLPGQYLSANYARVLSSSSSLFLSPSTSPCRPADRPHPSWSFSPRRPGVEKLIRLMAQPCSVTFVKFADYFGHGPTSYANWFTILAVNRLRVGNKQLISIDNVSMGASQNSD